jgi:Glycosyl hydrolase family 53
MNSRRALIAVIVVLSLACHGGAAFCATNLPEGNIQPRTFRMGFTPFAPDDTPEAVAQVTQFMRANADIVAEHMESVPWSEALTGSALSQNLMNNWRSRKQSVPPKAAVYLALSPGRGALADTWGATEHDPLPKDFQGKTFSDLIVEKAYLAYCKQAIEFFKPQFMAIGIEFNELIYNAPDKTASYAELHRYVYQELKKSYPNLPIFASFTVHSLLDERHSKADRDRCLEYVKSLMPYNDLVGISYYPFFGNLSGRLDEVFTWLGATFDSYSKPYAVAETGEAAKNLTVQMDGKPWNILGSPEAQTTYYQKLFAFADRHNMAFIISFLCIDYDALWKKIASTNPAVFEAWENNGFVDAKGEIRPAYKVWRQCFDRPLVDKRGVQGAMAR